MRKEETVDYHIKVAWHAISRMYNQAGVNENVTASTGFVLLNIDKYEGTPATKIAPMLGMEARSLTRLLKSMENSGLITRVQDEQDKRSVRIKLTDEGRRRRSFSKSAVLLFNESVRDKVSESDLKSFFKVMKAVDEVVEASKNFDTKTILTSNE